MRPESYREEQKTCGRCKHSVCTSEYDEGDYYYCSKDAPARPDCGSVFMNESHYHRDKEEAKYKELGMELTDIENGNPKYEAYRKWCSKQSSHLRALWDDWREGRSVSRLGTCNEWKENE